MGGSRTEDGYLVFSGDVMGLDPAVAVDALSVTVTHPVDGPVQGEVEMVSAYPEQAGFGIKTVVAWRASAPMDLGVEYAVDWDDAVYGPGGFPPGSTSWTPSESQAPTPLIGDVSVTDAKLAARQTGELTSCESNYEPCGSWEPYQFGKYELYVADVRVEVHEPDPTGVWMYSVKPLGGSIIPVQYPPSWSVVTPESQGAVPLRAVFEEPSDEYCLVVSLRDLVARTEVESSPFCFLASDLERFSSADRELLSCSEPPTDAWTERWCAAHLAIGENPDPSRCRPSATENATTTPQDVGTVGSPTMPEVPPTPTQDASTIPEVPATPTQDAGDRVDGSVDSVPAAASGSASGCSVRGLDSNTRGLFLGLLPMLLTALRRRRS